MQFFRKIKTRIALSFSLLFLAVAIPAIIYALHQVDLFFQGMYLTQMLAAGKTVSVVYSPVTALRLDSLASAVSDITTSSVFIISPNGAILTRHYESTASDTAYQLSLPILLADSTISRQEVRHRVIEVDRRRYLQVQAQLPDGSKLLQVKSLDAVSYLMFQMRRVIIFASFLVLIALVAVAFWVSANIIHPLERLTAFAQKIRADQLPERIEIKSPDEVGDLAQNLNLMVEDLRQSRERVANLENIRRDFFVRVHEELEAPLAAIRGQLESSIASVPANDPHNGAIIRQAIRQVTNLERTMHALIAISRLELGEAAPQIRQFKLRDLINGVANLYREEIFEKKLDFPIEVPAGLENCIIEGDEELLAIVLSNLIANAVASTDEGFIKIVCSDDDDRLKVTVEDSGRGIPAQHLSRIFERFYRIPDNVERPNEHEQAGLGLAIAKHIIEAHGQELQVYSQLGLGSKFSFYLPKHQLNSAIHEC